MDVYFNKPYFFGQKELEILSQDKYPINVRPVQFTYREPSKVDETNDPDYGVVGYMGDGDVEQAQYNIIMSLEDKFKDVDDIIGTLNDDIEQIGQGLDVFEAGVDQQFRADEHLASQRYLEFEEFEASANQQFRDDEHLSSQRYLEFEEFEASASQQFRDDEHLASQRYQEFGVFEAGVDQQFRADDHQASQRYLEFDVFEAGVDRRFRADELLTSERYQEFGDFERIVDRRFSGDERLASQRYQEFKEFEASASKPRPPGPPPDPPPGPPPVPPSGPDPSSGSNTHWYVIAIVSIILLGAAGVATYKFIKDQEGIAAGKSPAGISALVKSSLQGSISTESGSERSERGGVFKRMIGLLFILAGIVGIIYLILRSSDTENNDDNNDDDKGGKDGDKDDEDKDDAEDKDDDGKGDTAGGPNWVLVLIIGAVSVVIIVVIIGVMIVTSKKVEVIASDEPAAAAETYWE